jgi:hypothetical protein
MTMGPFLHSMRGTMTVRQADELAANPPMSSEALSRNEQTQQLEERLDKLTLVCMAMWSLLQQTSGLTEEQLIERVEQIDKLDGVADGKITRQAAPCPACKRMMSLRHKRCIYCGHERPVASAFDTV